MVASARAEDISYLFLQVAISSNYMTRWYKGPLSLGNFGNTIVRVLQTIGTLFVCTRYTVLPLVGGI